MARTDILHLLTTALLATTAAAQAPSKPARVVPYPIDLPPAFEAAIENGTRTTDGHPGAKHWTNYARYAIAVEVDPAAHRLSGTATMTYVNRSPDALGSLTVHLYQDMMRQGQQRTRTVVTTDGVQIDAIRLDDTEVPLVQRFLRGLEAPWAMSRDTVLRVQLDEPIESGGERTIEIDFGIEIPRGGTAPRMGYEGEDVIYLGYWYPQFAVYDDVEGWVADPYRGNGEFYMDYADYDVAVTVPVGYLVRATGALQNPGDVLTDKAQEQLGKALEQREIVHVVDADDLANGTATRESDSGKLTWRFHAENVRDCAVSIGRTYVWDATHAVVKDKHGAGQDGTCMIHAVYETNSGDWTRGAEYARHTIEYMSAQVHPYPWPHMTACEGVIGGGGMEYPMMTIIDSRRPAGTIAHELIHMWFPMLVGSNEKRYAWQDEGFTSFWTSLCRDDFNGQGNGGQRAVMMAGMTIGRGGDVVCMRHADAYGGDSFGFASYSKTAAILHQLRGLIGDEKFFQAFREYAADWAFKHPYPYDFFHTFSRVAEQDLQPFFRTWFFEAWPLDHAIVDVRVDGGKTTVRVADRGRALLPTTVEITLGEDRKVRKQIDAATWNEQSETVVTFDGEATEVVLDPDVVTIDANRENNRWRSER